MDEQLTLVKFLRNAVRFKDEQILNLQMELESTKETSEQQEHAATAEAESTVEQLTHDNQVLRLELQRQMGELHSYTVLEPEIAHLRKTNGELSFEIQAMKVKHEKAVRRLGDDFFKYRQALQEEFSNMVAQ